MFSNFFYSLLFIADGRQSFDNKLFVYFKLLLQAAPIVYIIDLAGGWFDDNKKFVTFFIATVMINAVFGLWKHKKMNEFDWETFFVKTLKMLAVVITTYVLLSMLSGIVDDLISKYFEMTIQVMTLFYPTSKALKSIFVISNGDYPPKWLMKKVYNFESDGDIHELFKTKKSEDYEREDN